MLEKVDAYCELFKAIYESVSKINSEHVIEISLTMFQEIAKDVRSEQIAELRLRGKSTETIGSKDLATTKQREAIHKFGVKTIPENLSKEEASEILDMLVGFSKSGDSESIAKLVEELNAKWKRSQ